MAADELYLKLNDTEWPMEYIDHDRVIVRAIVYDAEGFFYFVRVERDDEFGKETTMETSGGGVEAGEDLEEAIRRELKEELGAEVSVIERIGVVDDYYNLIHRHNISHYYLCKAETFGENHLTFEEKTRWHLSTARMTYEEAIQEYRHHAGNRLGRLLMNRELPVLQRAYKLLQNRTAQ